jgi:hypothetical protein
LGWVYVNRADREVWDKELEETSDAQGGKVEQRLETSWAWERGGFPFLQVSGKRDEFQGGLSMNKARLFG